MLFEYSDVASVMKFEGHIVSNLQVDCCPDSRILKQWRPEQPKSPSHYREMRVTIGVLMPPWGRKMFVHIHIDPTVPLPVARDFVALLQKNFPESN